MTAATTAEAPAATSRPTLLREMTDIATFLASLRSQVTFRDVRTGLWYTKLLRAYLSFYEQHREPIIAAELSCEERDRVARGKLLRASIVTSFAAAAAAGGVTAASIATARTAGVAGPVALPLAGMGMVSEMVLRAIVHLKLVCDLAELHGMRIDPGRDIEILRLYALAVHAEMHQTEDDPGRGLVERVMRLQQAGGLGKLVASDMIGETLLRNAVPFADIVFSSFRNAQLTSQVGKFVEGYASRRVRLDQAMEAVNRKDPDAVDLVVEGIWFIFINDGRLTGIETALLAHMMRGLQTSDDLTTYFVGDEAGWLERLAQVDAEVELRELMLRALCVAAEIEGAMTPSKLTIVKRAAQTLGLDVAAFLPAGEPAPNVH
jgi:uncharacterized protein (DUF697 family)